MSWVWSNYSCFHKNVLHHIWRTKSYFALKRGVVVDLKICNIGWKRAFFTFRISKNGVFFKFGCKHGCTLWSRGSGGGFANFARLPEQEDIRQTTEPCMLANKPCMLANKPCMLANRTLYACQQNPVCLPTEPRMLTNRTLYACQQNPVCLPIETCMLANRTLYTCQ